MLYKAICDLWIKIWCWTKKVVSFIWKCISDLIIFFKKLIILIVRGVILLFTFLHSRKYIFWIWSLFIFFFIWGVTDVALVFEKVTLIDNNESILDTLFTAVVMISVLSLTILSIVVNSNHSFYGIEFRKYVVFKTFPIRYRDLLIISFVSILYSIGLLVFEESFILMVMLVFIVVTLLIYSVTYFSYLMNKSKVRKFLVSSETLRNYGDLILISAYRYYNDGLLKRPDKESLDVLEYIREIKEGVDVYEK